MSLIRPTFGTRPNLAHPSLRGLIGWWLFTEGGGEVIYDLSVGRSNGSMKNMDSASDWVNTSKGRALYFDGVNDYVDIPDKPILNTTGDAFTASLWVKSFTSSNSYPAFIAKSDGAGITAGFRFDLTLTSRKLRLLIKTSAGNKSLAGLNDLTTDTWHYITATFYGTGQAIYIDGVLDNSMSYSATTMVAASSSLTINDNNNHLNNFNTMYAADVHLYNRSLSVVEILAKYNNPYISFTQKRKIFFDAPDVTVHEVDLPLLNNLSTTDNCVSIFNTDIVNNNVKDTTDSVVSDFSPDTIENKVLDLSNSTQFISEIDLTLTQNYGIIPTVTYNINLDISFSQIDTISNSGGLLFEVDIVNALTQAVVSGRVRAVNTDVALSIIEGESVSVQSDYEVDVPLSGTFALNYIVSAIHELGFTLASIDSLVIGVAQVSGSFTLSDCRKIDVVYENRTITVQYENRTIQLRCN